MVVPHRVLLMVTDGSIVFLIAEDLLFSDEKDDGSENDESEEERESAQYIGDMINFICKPRNFQSLSTAFKMLLLPQHLRDIVSSHSVKVQNFSTKSLSNQLKAPVEDYTMLE